MINYHNNKVRVLFAGEKGRGVFANRVIRKGEEIECSPVILIPEAEWRLIECTVLGDYVFETEEDGVCVALGYASLYNHSFESNASFDPHDDYIRIVATKKIRIDEEICVDYNWDPLHYYENKIISKEEYKDLLEEEEDE